MLFTSTNTCNLTHRHLHPIADSAFDSMLGLSVMSYLVYPKWMYFTVNMATTAEESHEKRHYLTIGELVEQNIIHHLTVRWQLDRQIKFSHRSSRFRDGNSMGIKDSYSICTWVVFLETPDSTRTRLTKTRGQSLFYFKFFVVSGTFVPLPSCPIKPPPARETQFSTKQRCSSLRLPPT